MFFGGIFLQQHSSAEIVAERQAHQEARVPGHQGGLDDPLH
jgi:hypothetical protein